MTLQDDLKAIIDNHFSDNQNLNIQRLENLRQHLEGRVNYERQQKKLFIVMREDPRDNLRLQFEVLKQILAVDELEIEIEEDSQNSPRREEDVIRWDIYRRSDPADRAVLKLTEDNMWSIGIAYPKKSDLCMMSLTRLLQRHKVDTNSLGGWNIGV